MLILISCLVALIVFILLYMILLHKKSAQIQSSQRLKGLVGNNPEPELDYEDEELAKSLGERVFLPLLNKIRTYVASVTPKNIYAMAEKKVEDAGLSYKWSVENFLLIWGGTAVLLPLIIYLIIFLIKAKLAGFNLVLCLLAGVIFGLLLPLMIINRYIANRRAKILKSLPDVLDLLCVSVQAGLAFDGALDKVSEKMKGPLIDECTRMLQEMRVGVARRLALQRLGERCGVQDVSLFAASLIQADQLGVSIVRVLEVQSENVREKRRQRVKEEALKAPVKLLFPLVLFIFPAIFIVLLAPALLSITKNMFGK